MYLRELELHDVRSYGHAEVEIADGVTVLLGANAQGKTNLLEAVYRVATGGSHRVATDDPMVREGADTGVIRAVLQTDAGRCRTVEIEIGRGRTRTRVDGHDVRRTADAVGVLRAVLFAPEDVTLVRGRPSRRRRFLDDLLSQRRPAYAAARSEYDRVVRQRNQLLKQARELRGEARNNATRTLAVWTDQLVEHGTIVLAARMAAVNALAGPLDTLYRRISGRDDPVRVVYESSTGLEVAGRPGAGVPDRQPLVEDLVAALDAVVDDEINRGVTLVGPHRDDLGLTIGPLEARSYASQGEAWSLALALRLASCEVLEEAGDRPVVLLDDVFAELDADRRRLLAGLCDHWPQVLVSASVAMDVPVAGHRIDVVRDGGTTTLHPRGLRDVGGAA